MKRIAGTIGWVVSALFILMTATGCSRVESEEPIRISANQWIGYTPLFYANEKGWLKESGFSLKFVSSLSESLDLFNTRSVDAMASTQYEYFEAKRKNPDVRPVILFDRSNGGDMILANRPLEAVCASPRIDVYLEQGSINIVLLKDFAREYRIGMERMRLHETNPFDLKELVNDPSRTMLVVTYAPYHKALVAKGFRIVDSTQTMGTLLVIDALVVDRRFYERHEDRFRQLKRYIDAAVEVSRKDPKGYYETVRSYMGETDYAGFLGDLASILWINRPDERILDAMARHGIDVDRVIR